MNKSDTNILKEKSKKKTLFQEHQENLGMNIPDNYFATSKKEILKTITKLEQTRKPIIRFKASFIYAIAASLLLAFGLTFWMQNNKSVLPNDRIDLANTFELESDESLLSSLFVADSKIDEFLDGYIVNEIIVETAIAEYNLDAILINSFFLEDTLVDDYFENAVIDNILL